MTIRNFLLLASLAGTAFPLTAQVTFSENVAPILYNRCTGCHRPGEAAPFSLISYDDAAKRGKLIAAVTASRLMPPWRDDPGLGESGHAQGRPCESPGTSEIPGWLAVGHSGPRRQDGQGIHRACRR